MGAWIEAGVALLRLVTLILQTWRTAEAVKANAEYIHDLVVRADAARARSDRDSADPQRLRADDGQRRD
jgi:hypothetical protein